MHIDWSQPQALADPFPLYDRLRQEDPIHWSDSLGGWILTRYADVLRLYRHPQRYSADRFRQIDARYASRRPDVQAVARVLRDWMVFRDPPDHTRLRRLLHQSFTPRQLERQRPRIETLVRQMLQAIEGEAVDYIGAFAQPLPARVICILLGVPLAKTETVQAWSEALAAYLGGAQTQEDNFSRAHTGLELLLGYFRELLVEKKAHPAEDLISLMCQAAENGRYSEDEVLANCVLLLFAGHETTTSLLGTGLYHLLRHKDAFPWLTVHPEQTAQVVEELLRYDGPVPATTKIARQDENWDGRAIQAGQQLFPFHSAANRDPQVFEDPAVLRLERPNARRNLAFGYGIHFCLGAPLARLEAEIVFRVLGERYRRIVLLEEHPPFRPQLFLRGVERLRLELQPA